MNFVWTTESHVTLFSPDNTKETAVGFEMGDTGNKTKRSTKKGTVTQYLHSF